MYYIEKTFEMSSAHRLCELPGTHKCNAMHGHNFEVTIVVGAEVLDDTGFVIEFSELARIVDDRVLRYLDHHDINEAFRDLKGGQDLTFQPTAERMARWISHQVFDELPDRCIVKRVIVRETEHSAAVWEYDANS